MKGPAPSLEDALTAVAVVLVVVGVGLVVWALSSAPTSTRITTTAALPWSKMPLRLSFRVPVAPMAE